MTLPPLVSTLVTMESITIRFVYNEEEDKRELLHREYDDEREKRTKKKWSPGSHPVGTGRTGYEEV
jgi:hypothetical protein